MDAVSNQQAVHMLIRKLESIAAFSAEERQAIQNLPVWIKNLSARQDIVRVGDQPGHCCLILYMDGFAGTSFSPGKASDPVVPYSRRHSGRPEPAHPNHGS